jgi:hypothetical protein
LYIFLTKKKMRKNLETLFLTEKSESSSINDFKAGI